jgi:hypothetical protein
MPLTGQCGKVGADYYGGGVGRMSEDRIRELCEGQPEHVIQAVLELERRGMRFCGDFGYENAVALLAEKDGRVYCTSCGVMLDPEYETPCSCEACSMDEFAAWEPPKTRRRERMKFDIKARAAVCAFDAKDQRQTIVGELVFSTVPGHSNMIEISTGGDDGKALGAISWKQLSKIVQAFRECA